MTKFFFFFFLFSYPVARAQGDVPVLSDLGELGFAVNPAIGLVQKKNESRSAAGFSWHHLVFEKTGLTAEITVHSPVSKKAAENTGRSVLNALYSVYQPRKSPYIGDLSELTSCDHAYLPQRSSFFFFGQYIDYLFGGT